MCLGFEDCEYTVGFECRPNCFCYCFHVCLLHCLCSVVLCVITEADVDKTTAVTKNSSRDTYVEGKGRVGKGSGEEREEERREGEGKRGVAIHSLFSPFPPFYQSKAPSVEQSFHLIPGSFHFSMLSLSVAVHKSQRYV